MSDSESRVQSLVRLKAARFGLRLFRNNVGVLRDDTGRPVRYGLGNDSPAINAVIKSGDLIGFEPVIITPDMVGRTIARFISVECKRGDWKPDPKDAREIAQRNWANLVNDAGGRAIFATSDESL